MFEPRICGVSRPAGTLRGRAGAARGSARTRVGVATLVGLCCGVLVATSTAWPVAVLAGWDGGAGVSTGWVWVAVKCLSADDARRLATGADPSRAVADLLFLRFGTEDQDDLPALVQLGPETGSASSALPRLRRDER